MSEIILDFGSGNTCHNDKVIIERMYSELKAVDFGKHKVIVKWQLFEKAGNNIPLTWDAFHYAYEYGKRLGYPVTASAFDKNSLYFLLQHEVPFVKIANHRELDWLIGDIPRKIPVYVSVGCVNEWVNLPSSDIEGLFCVSKYPAQIQDYIGRFSLGENTTGFNFSDHTTDFELWKKFQPKIVEWHYKLPDSVGLDAGPFARIPEQLAEVL